MAARMELEGRTALVTGASRGLGRALVEALAARGCRVVALARDGAALEALARRWPGQVFAAPLDLADGRAVDGGLPALLDAHPDLSLVFNNAAIQVGADFVSGEAAARLGALRQEIDINLGAVAAVCAHVLPRLAARGAPRGEGGRGEGAIVNIGSGLGIAPKRSAPVYCASKAALRALTRALRYQCEDQAPGVRMVDVVLPLVDTDMTAGRGRGKMAPARAARRILEGLEAGRPEILVGASGLLAGLMRLAPALAYRLLRNG